MGADILSTSTLPHAHTFTDTHCHLDLHQFDADRGAVIARAAAAGVAIIVNPAVDLESCRRILGLAEQHPNVYAAVGVHPNDCGDFDDASVTRLRALAQHPKVVAVGEIGLDYYREKVAHEQQRRVFRAQLALAAEHGLPVILHSRNARDDAAGQCAADLLWELEQWVPAARKNRGQDVILGVWHAFSGDIAEAERAYELGLVLGLGGPITFQNARRLRALVPQLCLDRLMLETDAPYLAPHPHRGQRNEPQYIPLMAQSLAQLYDLPIETLAARTTATARRCFQLDMR